MREIGLTAAAAIVVWWTGGAATAAAAAVILDTLIVRVYDNAGLLEGERARAMTSAREILIGAEVYVDWRDCPAGRGGGRGCSTVPDPRDLAVRLVRSPKNQANDGILGTALIDPVTGSGTLATVFVDRVQAVARQGHADPWMMMGRVMAHEIGHLLLGSNSHAGTGLMRELWTLQDLTRNRREDWLFSRPQREDLRNAGVKRAGVTG